MKVAYVVVELGAKNIDKPFTYLIPDYMLSSIELGMRVLVPFGPQKIEGFVIKIDDYNESDFDYKLRNIIRVIDTKPVLTSEMLKLGQYIKDSTLSYLISAYQVMLPAALKARKRTNINIKNEVYVGLTNDKVLIDEVLSNNRAKKQHEVIDYIKENGVKKRSSLNKIYSSSIVKTLVDKGVLIITEKEVYRDVIKKDYKIEAPFTLTNEQHSVYEKINNSLYKPETFLLHGVTGSGKTEIYLQIIKSVVDNGRQAIMLVPEISLTPQMVSHFVKRFGNKVAIMHSGLSNAEKYDEWRKINRSEVNIVIGARSAIFAPFENLGVIIIDEEHEGTYRQDNHPKYHARDIAKWRIEYHNCLLILGSATPTLESYARAIKGVYTLLSLPNRVNKKQLPEVEIIDMREDVKSSKNLIFSNVLIDKLRDRLNKKEQSILLLNRRGYSNFITCRECGYTQKCPHCDISLTYHKSTNTMRCHYCGYGDRLLNTCPECNSNELQKFGIGTQKVEEGLKEILPNVRVVRMDQDTTSRKGSHEKILDSFKEGEYDILLGTQMIAKGLDFPRVTLVGVLNADTMLNLPDFRSSERTFQLINQVSGRAGRHKLSGEVVIQTYNKDHYSIMYAKNHDFLGFFKYEMDLRHKIGYPPYYFLIKVLITSKENDIVIKAASNVGNYIRRNVSANTIVLGPSVSGIPKLNDYYRYQCLIKYKKDDLLNNTLLSLIEHYKDDKKVNVEIDIEPQKLM